MIRGFESPQMAEPEGGGRLQWGPALAAGFIAGFVLLLVPRGSPWASLTFFIPVVMGRSLPYAVSIPLPVVWAIHLALAVLYGLFVSKAVARLPHQRAILTGGVCGLILYVINYGIVSLCWPAWHGNEIGVIFTHVVFGLIAGGAYRGLLRRKPLPAPPRVQG